MTDIVNTLKQFLDDELATDMYIEGEAGTGKTTNLAQVVEYMQKTKREYIVTAFTHKACGILRSKLPDDANIGTFHAWLKKRPTINQDATHIKHIESNSKTSKSELVELVSVDEFSMIGEADMADLRAEQVDPETGKVRFKVLWLGDPNQLSPVGDTMAVKPQGKYHITLTRQYRTSTSSPLYRTLSTLVSYLQGQRPIEPLLPHSNLVRDICLESTYKADKADKVLLAFTNERVEELNATMQGYEEPLAKDELFSPTTRHKYTFQDNIPGALVYELDRPFGQPLDRSDKFNTLGYLEQLSKTRGIQFASVHNHELDEEQTVAYVFGHYQFKLLMADLKLAAAEANAAIESQFNMKAAVWAKQNQGHPLERRRAKAWREFLAVNKNCMCLDFAHAMTVHKSQGSTYEHVYVDTQDLGKAARNLDLYLRLTYVAFSRASGTVFTN